MVCGDDNSTKQPLKNKEKKQRHGAKRQDALWGDSPTTISSTKRNWRINNISIIH